MATAGSTTNPRTTNPRTTNPRTTNPRTERQLSYALVDADTHYYEPRDFISAYIDPAYRDRCISVRRTDDDMDQIMFGSEPMSFLTHHADFDRAPRPGGLKEQFRALKQTGRLEKDDDFGVPVKASWREPFARLEEMDQQGVEVALAFPTRGVCFEFLMRDDTDLLYAHLAAFNRWLDEQWGYATDNRLFAPPLMNLTDIDRAVEHLDAALARGTRAVHLQCGPQGGRAPGDPHNDPFWERINEAGIPVAFHIGPTGLNEMYGAHWGENPNPAAHQQSAFQWTCTYGDTAIMHTLASMIYHNLFGRFPNVQVLSVEHGSLWVPYLLSAMDKMKGMGRNGPWPGGYVSGRPSEVFKHHVRVVPYQEEPIDVLVAALGVDRVLMGSDYPHSEGVSEPIQFLDSLAGFDDDDVRKIMRDNTLSMLGLA